MGMARGGGRVTLCVRVRIRAIVPVSMIARLGVRLTARITLQLGVSARVAV